MLFAPPGKGEAQTWEHVEAYRLDEPGATLKYEMQLVRALE